MLEQLLIFTRGGLILWTYRELGNALKGSPIDTLIRSCLLEERSGSSTYHYDAPGVSYTLKWTFHNELGLVFVAAYQRILQLFYVDDLLSMIKQEFSHVYSPKQMAYSDFSDIFRQLREEAEKRSEEMKKSVQVNKAITGAKNLGRTNNISTERNNKKGNSSESGNEDGENIDTILKGNNFSLKQLKPVNFSENKNESSNIGAFNVNKLKKLRGKGDKKNPGLVNKGTEVKQNKKLAKKNRIWDEASPDKKLDFTDPVELGGDKHASYTVAAEGDSLMDKEEGISSDSESDTDQYGTEDTKIPKKKGLFSSILQSFAGKATLEKDDLEPALRALKDSLMAKNVAEEIAEKLCESVAVSLEGKKLASFTRISSTVRVAMEAALVRILTPKRSIDILRDVQAAREEHRPYVVVFVGVNGVGKSTNLAKVAYWLLQHNVSVLMAACDTFRSGAVEQLRTHARRLQIPLFEKGYEKDPAVVAKEAVQDAARNGSDVVLVDTAGRMQENEPLMRALSKLIHMNNPDLVLFVGEALVGNDAVDQLSKFNQKLADLSPSTNARLIDGILLTKFDTVDDKVGAALSMVYVSGAPVMFVGCGQSYTDLKKLNGRSIVKTLLK